MKVYLAIVGIVCSLKCYSQAAGTDSIKSDSIPTTTIIKQENKSIPTVIKTSASVNNIPFADGYDRIIKLNKDTLVVTILKVTAGDVSFLYPLNKAINRLPIFHIKEIIGKDGKPNATFNGGTNTAKVNENDSTQSSDWKTIVLTSNPGDVDGMENLGDIEASSEGERVTTNAALVEKNAIFHLKKKAALMGATKVLVTEKNALGGYGETPTIQIKGIAYR